MHVSAAIPGCGCCLCELSHSSYFPLFVVRLQDMKEHHTDTSVHFELHLSPETMAIAESEGLMKKFKLNGPISTTNMHLFEQGRPHCQVRTRLSRVRRQPTPLCTAPYHSSPLP